MASFHDLGREWLETLVTLRSTVGERTAPSPSALCREGVGKCKVAVPVSRTLEAGEQGSGVMFMKPDMPC